MKTIIHDLDKNMIKKISFKSNDVLIDASKCINSCIGCFSCWIKHPTKCMYKDEYSNITNSLQKSDELVIITKNWCGSYNDRVKRVLERCIGYVHPYFTIREGRIHHQSRYQEKIKFTVYVYGNITDNEKKTFKELVKANSINLNASHYQVIFVENVKELKNVYID